MVRVGAEELLCGVRVEAKRHDECDVWPTAEQEGRGGQPAVQLAGADAPVQGGTVARSVARVHCLEHASVTSQLDGLGRHI